MAVIEGTGAYRAWWLLMEIPTRFNEFTHMDQFTFDRLADWILTNARTTTGEQDISVEESLFIFLDVVARGSSFRDTADGWYHDIQLTKSIFLNVLNALQLLREREGVSPSVSAATTNSSRARWSIVRDWTPKRMRCMDNIVRIGDDRGCAGLEVERDRILEAITALNNWMYQCQEQ